MVHRSCGAGTENKNSYASTRTPSRVDHMPCRSVQALQRVLGVAGRQSVDDNNRSLLLGHTAVHDNNVSISPSRTYSTVLYSMSIADDRSGHTRGTRAGD